jgi:hypothetical protein
MADFVRKNAQFARITARFAIHSDLVLKCSAIVSKRGIDRLADLEHSIVTRTDGRGGTFSPKMSDIIPFLTGPSYQLEDKIKLAKVFGENVGYKDDELKFLQQKVPDVFPHVRTYSTVQSLPHLAPKGDRVNTTSY